MAKLAIVGGHSLLGSGFATGCPRRGVTGIRDEEPVVLLDAGSYLVLQHHGLDVYTPPHLIDHVAHARALASMGCDRVLALSSVGSLRRDLGVGSLVVPDDFVALDAPTRSSFTDGRGHTVPGFDTAWRARVVAAAQRHDGAVVDGGVYWQTVGPRFETPAEIRYLARFADLVGMTVGSECVAAGERGLAYAAVCVVDNLANGLAEAPLTIEEFEAGKAANRQRVLALLEALVGELAA